MLILSMQLPMWRNWYTHSTQNAARNHVGSSPTIGTIKKDMDIIHIFLIFKWWARKGVCQAQAS